MATRDSNAYLPGTFLYGSSTLTGTRPNPIAGHREGVLLRGGLQAEPADREHQCSLSPKFNLFGFYNLTYVHSDTGTASNSYNLMQDYGRAGFAPRNMVFLMGNYTGPWNIIFNPFLIAQSGRPYNLDSQRPDRR